MASLNKVQLIGNLGRDPEIRYSSDGRLAICTFPLATSRVVKNPSTGETTEETEWHRCVFFGKQGENIQKYMRKGSQMYVEGRVRTRKYDKDGVTFYSTEIMGETSMFLGARGNETSSYSGVPDYPEARGFTSSATRNRPGEDEFSKPPQKPTSAQKPEEEDPFSKEEEDMPF